MKIEGLGGLNPVFPKKLTPEAGKAGFDNVIVSYINDVNKAQKTSSEMVNEFLTGGNVEIHDVMIAGEKAKTALDLLMEIRNKTVDMYKELTRMQI